MLHKINGFIKSNKVLILGFVFVFPCLTAIAFYLCRFAANGLSHRTSDWGIFGDYLGGILGTWVSICNLIVTYYVAKFVNEFAKGENDRQVAVQKKIIVSQLMNDSLKDFKNDIHKRFESIKSQEMLSSSTLISDIENAISAIEFFYENNHHLFNKHTKFHSRVVVELREAIGHIRNDRTTHNMNRMNPPHTLSTSQILEPSMRSLKSMLSLLGMEIITKLQ